MKTKFAFVALVALLFTLASCATQKGYNYSAHARKNKSLHHQSFSKNRGNVGDMTNWKCTKRH